MGTICGSCSPNLSVKEAICSSCALLKDATSVCMSETKPPNAYRGEGEYQLRLLART